MPVVVGELAETLAALSQGERVTTFVAPGLKIETIRVIDVHYNMHTGKQSEPEGYKTVTKIWSSSYQVNGEGWHTLGPDARTVIAERAARQHHDRVISWKVKCLVEKFYPRRSD